ncbi:sigma factor-like helix-turn-helix DNA-binding protein [Streptomyces sp. NPDC007988]|uniref:sigma factor-like helix-turn-helix DNA-binding protein n=1 Tax=Streptomyces sp. NPDC007988 TaxID=3364802 RepID=UPI0036F121BE
MTKSAADSTEAAAPPLPSPKERRRLREAKALSEEQLAEALGVTRATVRAWETGRSDPRGRKREAYAKLLAAYEAELSARESLPEADEEAGPAESATGEERTGSPSPAPDRRRGDGGRTGGTESSGDAAPTREGRDTPTESPAAGSRAPTRSTTGSCAASPAAATPTTGSSASGYTGSPAPTRSTTGGASGNPVASPAAGYRKAAAARPGASAPPPPPDPPRPYPATVPVRTSAERPEASGTTRQEAPGGEEATDTARPAEPSGRPPVPDAEGAAMTAEQAFDELYARTAPDLVRQTLLLTGRQSLSREAVERAFHLAWQRWPEVAVDRDPSGWVRAAAYEYAMSPWHRLRRAHRRADPVASARPAAAAYPGGRTLREALLGLPPSYRRTLLLYDGLGLDLPETAAETEASTPAAAHRLLHARAAVAEQIPELAEPDALQHELSDLVANLSAPRIASARSVRGGSERRAELWTRAAIGLTVLILGAAAVTMAVTEDHYEPPQAPGERVGGVPPRSGPEPWSKEDYRLRVQLRSHPGAGPARLVPLAR